MVDVSDIFYFFCSGRGKGGSRRRRAVADRFFIEKPRRGGGSPGQEGPRGREGVCSELGNLGGGGQIFFFGAEMSTKNLQ